jgi:hypothetical protein
MDISSILKDIVIPSVAIMAFIKGIIEYVKSQKWKKSEVLSKEIKEFFNDKDVKVVLTMLDYNSRRITIDGELVRFNDEMLQNSLITHNKKKVFEVKEAMIRDKFDIFFDKLSIFENYISNSLVNECETIDYLSYYLRILTKSGSKSKEVVETFNQYLVYYKYDNVLKLLDRYTRLQKKRV